MFQKNLTDLIRGIRSHKNNPDKFILQQLEDLRNELKSTDLNVKTTALSKLNYVS
jgi:AP-3 complex subunit delta-1